MRFRFQNPIAAIAGLAGAVLLCATVVLARDDLGLRLEREVRDHAEEEFGIGRPLTVSSQRSISAAEAIANPNAIATLAGGLRARVVTTAAGANTDMMALWPDDLRPTHLITCNEQGVAQPGVQRITISTGEVATIVTGTSSCDGLRRTPWGTILFSEEAGGGPNGGRAYELIRPLETTGVTLNRATGVFSGGTGNANLTARPALGRLSFEGFAVYPSGLNPL